MGFTVRPGLSGRPLAPPLFLQHSGAAFEVGPDNGPMAQQLPAEACPSQGSDEPHIRPHAAPASCVRSGYALMTLLLPSKTTATVTVGP